MLKKIKIYLRTNPQPTQSALDALNEFYESGLFDSETGEITYDDEDAESSKKVIELLDKIK